MLNQNDQQILYTDIDSKKNRLEIFKPVFSPDEL